MKVTYQELSDITGKHKNTIINRLTASTLTCDDLGPGKPKLWESGDALLVIYEAEIRQMGGGCQPGALDLNAERARLAKEQADAAELKNAQLRKELLPAESVKTEWVTMIVNAKTKLSGLPSKVSALTDEPDERRRIFLEAKKIVDEALTELGRGADVS